MKAIMGKKVGMTQIFTEDGIVIPVTVVEAGPCVVVQKKTVESDGYCAVQLGYGEIREKLVNKPKMGHFKKAGVPVKRYLKEFKTDEDLQIGAEIKADVFENGDLVDVTGITKGKGFLGVIARYGQHYVSRFKISQTSGFHGCVLISR